MELQLPDTPDKVEVPESNVMTLAVRDDGNMYERVAREPWRPIKVEEIKPTIEGLVAQRPQIIALIKVSAAAPYHHVVDIMDELNLAKFNRLSILRLEDPDLREVQGIP
jgi:biopolymer transport protein ExbD